MDQLVSVKNIFVHGVCSCESTWQESLWGFFAIFGIVAAVAVLFVFIAALISLVERPRI